MKKDLDILNTIREKRSTMSKGHKKLADYYINHYDKAAFQTALEIGNIVGVSESTVVRFPATIGISGFPKFQKNMAEYLRQKLHMAERIDVKDLSMDQNALITNVMMSDAERIQSTINSLNKDAFSIAVKDIVNASHVYIVGVRSCAALASYLYYNMNFIRKDVSLVNSSNANELFEQMLHIDEHDVVIGISFPRYSMRTLKAMEFANSRQAKVIAITDSSHSPMNMYSSCNLFAESRMATFTESMAAPVSLVGALIVALTAQCSDDVISNIEILNQATDNYSYQDDDEINYIDEGISEELKNISKEELA